MYCNTLKKALSFTRHLKIHIVYIRPNVNRHSQVTFFHTLDETKNNKNNIAFEKPLEKLEGSFENATSLYGSYFKKNSDEYKSAFLKEKLPLDTNSKILLILKQLSTEPDKQRESDDLITLVKEELKELTHSELLYALYLTITNLNQKEPNKCWFEIKNCLDNECFSRYTSLTFDESLQILDVLFSSKYFRKFSFVRYAILKFYYRVSKFTPKQVVHLFYFLTKFQPSVKEKFSFQDKLSDHISFMNVTELGIVCLGLFKTGMKVTHPEIFSKINSKLIPNIDNVNLLVLKNITECYKECATAQSSSAIKELQESTIPFVNKLNIDSLIYVASCGYNFTEKVSQIFVNKVLERAKEEIKNCDSSVFIRLISLCAKLCIKDEEFLKLAINKFHETENKSINDLISYTKNLLYFDIFDMHAIKTTLSENFLHQMMEKNYKKFLMDAKFIENCVELFKPEYDGPKFNEKANAKVKKIFKTNYFINTSRGLGKWSIHTLYDIQKCLNIIYGPNMHQLDFLLTNSFPCIVMRFNKNSDIVQIPKEHLPLRNSNIKIFNDNHIWLALILIMNKDLGLSNNINFITQTAIKYIEAHGYKSVMVFHNKWIEHKNSDSRLDFIKSSVTDKLKEYLNS